MADRCLDNETIAAFVAGEPTALSRREIEEHLDACEDCRALLAIVVAGASPEPSAEMGEPPTLEARPSPLGDAVFDLETAGPGHEGASASLESFGTMPAVSAFGGRFILDHVVGRGGMGTVFRASDLATGKPVALKLMRGEADTKRVAREVEVLAELTHPSIVRYVAHGPTTDGGLYLVMEWIDGLSLLERLQAGRLSVEETITLGLAVAEGLDEVHRRGVVHRDIKPGNLMLVDGSIEGTKIVDFGIARRDLGEAKLTLTGALLGTPGFMAPEQARGDANVGPSADLFALGAVLYQALTGLLPFYGQDVLAILMATVLHVPTRPSEVRADVPEELDDLVMALLAKSASERPADARAVRDALLRAREHVDVVSVPASRGLMADERRLFSVVLVRAGDGGEAVAPSSMSALAARHGGRVETLLDGSLFVALSGDGAPTDQAVRAARCALALQSSLPAAAISLATSRGLAEGTETPALERLARMPKSTGKIAIDEVTAGLLDARFDLGTEDGGFQLRRERAFEDEQRTLLGKPSPCVGREREIASLEAIFDECVAEPSARKVLVVGDAGIGKSRLRRELLLRIGARREPVEIWVGRGDPMSAGSPFSLLLPPLLRSAGVSPADPPDLVRRRLLARVARHVGLVGDDAARIAMFLAELAGAPFQSDASPALESARRDPRVMADQVGRAWYELIAAESAAGPLLVVLEDLHWGDRASVQVLSAALRALESSPILVLAFARPESRELFPELTITEGAEEIILRPLARRAGEDLVRAVLGRATATQVDRLLSLSQGNPFFLEELIRAEVEGRGDTPPDTVLAMLEARLGRLDGDARRALRAASVFGGVFWPRAIAAVLGPRSTELDVDRALATLMKAEMVTPEREAHALGEREYRFRHALLRETAYATLTDEDRREGHARAGDWLEARHAADALTLAEHFDRGGEPARAASAYQRAAEQALEASDAGATITLAERATRAALASGSFDVARLGDLHRLRAEAHRWRAEYAESERWAREALACVLPGSRAWFASATVLAVAGTRLGREELFAEAQRAIEGTEPIAGAYEERMKAMHAIATHYWFQGNVPAWEAIAKKVEAASEHETTPALQARLYQERARGAMRSGDLGAYVELVGQAMALAITAGNLRDAANMRMNLANGYMEIGEAGRVPPLMRELMKHLAFGLAYFLAGAKLNLARALIEIGSFDEGRAEARDAAQICAKAGDRRAEGGSRVYHAEALWGLSELEAAEAEARAAIELLAVAPPMRPRARAMLARILLTQGRVEEAREEAWAGLGEVKALGVVEEGEALARLVDVEAKLACGDDTEARHALYEARQRLLVRAGKIRDEGYRKTFLEKVPENARTLALAHALLGG